MAGKRKKIGKTCVSLHADPELLADPHTRKVLEDLVRVIRQHAPKIVVARAGAHKANRQRRN